MNIKVKESLNKVIGCFSKFMLTTVQTLTMHSNTRDICLAAAMQTNATSALFKLTILLKITMHLLCIVVKYNCLI